LEKTGKINFRKSQDLVKIKFLQLDLHARLTLIIRSYCGVLYKELWLVRTVSEKAIVNDRWTSNGQHVSHTTMHKMYIYMLLVRKKKRGNDASWPFCLNEEDRADCVIEECVCNICTSSDVSNNTFEMNICRKARTRAPLSFNSFESHTKRIGKVHHKTFVRQSLS